jgi:hypothetical protein
MYTHVSKCKNNKIKEKVICVYIHTYIMELYIYIYIYIYNGIMYIYVYINIYIMEFYSVIKKNEIFVGHR